MKEHIHVEHFICQKDSVCCYCGEEILKGEICFTSGEELFCENCVENNAVKEER